MESLAKQKLVSFKSQFAVPPLMIHPIQKSLKNTEIMDADDNNHFLEGREVSPLKNNGE